MSFVMEQKVADIEGFFKVTTYSQLFLMQRAQASLSKKPKEPQDLEFDKAVNGDGAGYAEYLRRNLP